MSKEAGQRHDQGPLSQTMRELETKNVEVGGILFSTVGREDERAFLFPTYITRQEGEATFNEFLVVTSTGMRSIQIFPVRPSFDYDVFHAPLDANYVSQSIIEADGAGGFKVKGERGERLEFRRGRVDLKVYVDKAGRKLGWGSVEYYEGNCKLGNPNEGQVEEMLTANMERVKSTRRISQKVSDSLSKI